jgi:hypothetical protein
MVDVDAKTLAFVIFSLIVAGMLQRTLLSTALDQFFAVDTSLWTWETVLVWNLLPTVGLAVVIFVLIRGLVDDRE